jgi:pimeloyl-ACP methyl ester carboxylesterase
VRRFAAILFTIAVTALGLLIPPDGIASAAIVNCNTQTVPVRVSPADPTFYLLSGRLCLTPAGTAHSNTVELLVSGLTYDRHYFDSSYQPEKYSYVASAGSRGYSTFNIDRLGVGLSSHPPAEKLTIPSHAYVIGQIVQKLRTADALPVRAFTNVVGVGHSLGTGILQYLAATATDRSTVPDYLVLGSFLTTTYGPGATRVGNVLYPATADPKFASSGLGPDYLTTQPGTRAAAFFNVASAETAMIDLDESTKQTGTVGERASIPAVRDPAILRAIKVPALITVGEYDNLYCDEASGLSCATSTVIKNREGANYSARACLSTYVVAGAGHSVGLHLNAADAYNATHNWVDRYTGTAGSKDANGCLP